MYPPRSSPKRANGTKKRKKKAKTSATAVKAAIEVEVIEENNVAKEEVVSPSCREGGGEEGGEEGKGDTPKAEDIDVANFPASPMERYIVKCELVRECY